ncbi:MAG TPA: hypothetical protein VNS46_08540 [Nocardioides sp.]|nr:hypothetical protein [Nocardioides sp.]
MPKLILLFVLALVGSAASFATPAVATATGADATLPTVGAPYTFFRGNVGPYSVRPQIRLRIDRADVNMPDATGEENLSWDVQVLRADMRAASRPAWQTAITGTTEQWHEFLVGSGRIICVRARQTSWGVTGAWSYRTCVVRALDDQALRRVGPVRLVRDVRYVDNRAARILPGTRMVIGGVPAGARYGPVYTDRPGDDAVCARPSWTIRGQREPDGSRGVASGALQISFHSTRVAGVAVMRSPYEPSCPVGGFIVVPVWAAIDPGS